jgi:DNA-binding NarL/FixJ family response regulator
MKISTERTKVIERWRIFIIDDNEILRGAIRLHDGFEAHELVSATGALSKAKQMKPDLLVLTEGVIRVNGTDLIQEFLARIPEAKILVVVDQVSSGFGPLCIAAGAHAFLAKPLRAEVVRDKVDALLNAKKKTVAAPLKVANMNETMPHLGKMAQMQTK